MVRRSKFELGSVKDFGTALLAEENVTRSLPRHGCGSALTYLLPTSQ